VHQMSGSDDPEEDSRASTPSSTATTISVPSFPAAPDYSNYYPSTDYVFAAPWDHGRSTCLQALDATADQVQKFSAMLDRVLAAPRDSHNWAAAVGSSSNSSRGAFRALGKEEDEDKEQTPPTITTSTTSSGSSSSSNTSWRVNQARYNAHISSAQMASEYAGWPAAQLPALSHIAGHPVFPKQQQQRACPSTLCYFVSEEKEEVFELVSTVMRSWQNSQQEGMLFLPDLTQPSLSASSGLPNNPSNPPNNPPKNPEAEELHMAPRFYENFYWNLLWTWKRPKLDHSKLLVWQKVNHFSRAKELTRKDNLKKHLDKFVMLRGFKFASQFRIMPPTYVLPHQFNAFLDSFTRESKFKNNVWITKPISSSRGRGISLLEEVNDINYGEHLIVQKYVCNPLLLRGYKFDLRLYVLVTSFLPLEAFIYNEGFARFCSVPFSLTDTHNLLVHLTNFAIQKYSATCPPMCDASNGPKLSLARLAQLLMTDLGVDWAELWEKIVAVVLKTLVAVQDSMGREVNSFEVYGFDVLIDTELRPWLLEVNASPSMATDTDLDRTTKTALINDTVALVNPLPFDRMYLHHLVTARLATGYWGNRAPKSKKEMKEVTQTHVASLLQGRSPRLYGETPEVMGKYEKIAPSTSYEKVMRMKRAAFQTRKSFRDQLPAVV